MLKSFKILRYGLMKRLKRGKAIGALLTYDCCLDCSYCTNKMVQGYVPDYVLHNGREWIYTIKKQKGIREVLISGGSPELHPDFVDIVTKLLLLGYFVQVYSNLIMLGTLQLLPETHRLMIVATYHRSCNPKLFSVHYDTLKTKYRVIVDEIAVQRFPYSRVKPFQTIQDLKDDNKIKRISPNLNIFDSCYDLYNEKIIQ